MTTATTTDTPKDQPPGHAGRTRAARAARAAIAALWVTTVGSVALLCAADLFPQRLANRTQPYLTLAAATFVIQTLQFHIAVICVACLAVGCVARRWKLAILATMGAMLGLAPGLRAALITVPAPADGGRLRLMSMNVFVHNDNAALVLDRVRRASPDVVILQEYTVALDEPIRAGLAQYPYQLRKPLEDSSGWGVYSRRPLVAPIDTSLRLHESARQARFGVRVGNCDVVVYALHLTSPRSIERIGLNRAEVADLLGLIAGERRPVILAGDFNFTSRTANAAALRGAGLRSTHDLAGNGRGSTWRYRKFTDHLPGFRIDHVFISKQLTCTNAQVLDPARSDHCPILADIALAVPEPPSDPVAAAQ